MSTDQAHSLGDVFGVPVPPTGHRTPVRVVAEMDPGGFLDALALDTLVLLEARWREIARPLGERFPQSELGDVAPEELSALPGIQEVLGLYEVGELAASGRWDHIVVDCASTADALRMLTLPATFGMYLERTWPRHRRLAQPPADLASAAAVSLLERVAEGLRLIGGDGEHPLPDARIAHRGGRGQRRLADPALADEQADPGPTGGAGLAGFLQPSTRFFRSFSAVSVNRRSALRLSNPIIGMTRSTDSS